MLDEICKNAKQEILDVARNTFEDILKRELNNSAMLGLSSGKINMEGELNIAWFTRLYQLLEPCYSNDVFKYLIQFTTLNPIFNGVKIYTYTVPNSNHAMIYFDWHVSKDEISITNCLKDILDENRLLIMNKVKTDFDNKLRQHMKFVASQGLCKGEFNFYGDTSLLANILDFSECRDVYKWLLDKILKENEDFSGIDIYVHHCWSKIIFKW